MTISIGQTDTGEEACLTAYLTTQESRLEMTFRWADGRPPPVALVDLIQVFALAKPDGGNPKITATPEMKARILAFADRYVGESPMFNKLKKLVGGLRDGEVFFITDRVPTSSKEKLEFELLLQQANTAPENYRADDLSRFAALLDHYDFDKHDNGTRKVFGETAQHLKRCRFCQRGVADGATFKQKAHAIPEGFGNKSLVLAEECDECNGAFGRGIEPALLRFLDPQRVFVSTRGKGGLLDVQLKGGRLGSEGKLMKVAARSITKTDNGFLADVGSMRFVPIDCYKALCKMALSVMKSHQLAALQETIRWVRFDDHAGLVVPKVATNILYFPAETSPEITVYVRKAPSPELPHVVGEFRLGCFMYVFALPLSSEDEALPLDFFERERFKEIFQHYQQAGAWSKIDFNNYDSIELRTTMRMVQRDSS